MFWLARPRKLERHIAAVRKRSFSLLFNDCGLTHRCFLEIFGFFLYGVLVLCLSLCGWIYAAQTGMFSRKIKFAIFVCSPAKIGAAHCRTFFARTKKVPKKYAEGVRTLSTPGDAVKLRLRFAPQVLRRYRKCLNMWKRKKTHFLFLP